MIVTLDQQLHTPMYFFLENVSFLDICLISTTVFKSITNSLTNHRSISFLELFNLTAMSYDLYVAICCPLRYKIIMNRGFFCDVPSVVNLSYSETYVALEVIMFSGFSLAANFLICILVSYIHIFSAVLRRPSTEGRTKAFSTCLPHLAVTTVFFTTAAFAHLKSSSASLSVLELMVSVFYTVVPPTLNPFIYTLRNRDMKAAMGRILGKAKELK
ncbi:olfactory receptor 14A2-like [Tachyglossus aculeatus]|uniref:olfactory receptor 14A2-like n=1 Tax=Tachyglossus aculeatus TaxID=9261 RepID=UPI0018F76930|nr:olfactory receptor 14A2-like [Tachyglossus aculeatus]